MQLSTSYLYLLLNLFEIIVNYYFYIIKRVIMMSNAFDFLKFKLIKNLEKFY